MIEANAMAVGLILLLPLQIPIYLYIMETVMAVAFIVDIVLLLKSISIPLLAYI